MNGFGSFDNNRSKRISDELETVYLRLRQSEVYKELQNSSSE